jgi:AraC-like DNA-binding protein
MRSKNRTDVRSREDPEKARLKVAEAAPAPAPLSADEAVRRFLDPPPDTREPHPAAEQEMLDPADSWTIRAAGLPHQRIANYVAERNGVDMADLCRRYGVPGESFERWDHQFPADVVLRMLDETATLTGDSNFGLHAAEQLRFGAFGLFDYLPASCATLGAALQKLTQMSLLLSDFGWAELRMDGEFATFTRRGDHPCSAPTRHAAELYMARVVLWARHVISPDWSPVEVLFRHRKPDRLDEHQRILRSPCLFDEPVDAVRFTRSSLDLGLQIADPGLLTLLDHHVRRAFAPASVPFIQRVREAMLEQSGDEFPDISQLAKRLKISRRSLQRHLQTEGISYQLLRDATRRDAALRYLAESDLPIAEIAVLVGYSNLGRFYAAFRRWTCHTPAAYRRSRRRGRAVVAGLL